MQYTERRVIRFPAAIIWNVLADLRHFERNDPYHHDLVFLDGQKRGEGARFTMRHTYVPIHPFRPDSVTCTVRTWEPDRRLVLHERNEKPFKSHVQEFVLQSIGMNETLVIFNITYRGVPLFLLPWKLWADWLVHRRMKQKLREIEEECSFAE